MSLITMRIKLICNVVLVSILIFIILLPGFSKPGDYLSRIVFDNFSPLSLILIAVSLVIALIAINHTYKIFGRLNRPIYEALGPYLGMIFLFSLIFYPVVKIPYAFYEDFRFWAYDPRTNIFSHPYQTLLILLGRILGSYLVALTGYFVHTIEDLSLLRMFSVMLLTSSACGMFYWLRRQGMDSVLSFFISIGVLLAPGLQVAIMWSCSVGIPLTVLLGVISSLILLKVCPPSQTLIISSVKSNFTPILTATLLLAVSMFFYQPTAMFFLVFPLLRILFFQREPFIDIRGRVFLDMSVFCMSGVLYFAINRLIVFKWLSVWHQDSLSSFMGRSDEITAKYHFKLLSLSQIPGKLALFFKKLTPMALNMFPFEFKFYPALVYPVILMFIGSLGLVAYRSWKTEITNKKNLFVNRFLPSAIMVFVLLLLSNAPTLLAKGEVVAPRTTIVYHEMNFIIFAWSIYHFIHFGKDALQIKVSRLTLGIVVGSLCLIAQHNTLRSALLWSTELKYLEAHLVPNLQKDLKIQILLPSWFNDDEEISTPSSFYSHITTLMLRSIFVSLGKADLFNEANISLHSNMPFEGKSNSLFIDMVAIANTFPHDNVSNPPSLKILEEDYLGFSIYVHKTPDKTSYKLYYYATPKGEYDLAKHRCHLGPCSKTLSADNLETIKDLIHDLTLDRTVSASSQLKEHGPSILDVAGNSAGYWVSQSSPKSAEWILVEYQTPQAIRRLRLLPAQVDICSRMERMKSPRDFVFQGSQDKKRWEDIYEVRGATFPKDCSWLSWSFVNNIPYKFYRIHITANNGDPNYVSLGRIELNSFNLSTHKAIFVGKITVSSSMSETLGANNLLLTDDSPPWVSHTPATHPEWILFDIGKPSVMSTLRIQGPPATSTGNLQLRRAPRDFIIQGSQDSEQWTDLLKVKDTRFVSANEWKGWKFDNSVAYKYYRLYITANNGDTVTSINRLELL